jgi:hypothetical protein
MRNHPTPFPVLPAKAGIQQRLSETLDSRFRGNDKAIESDSI